MPSKVGVWASRASLRGGQVFCWHFEKSLSCDVTPISVGKGVINSVIIALQSLSFLIVIAEGRKPIAIASSGRFSLYPIKHKVARVAQNEVSPSVSRRIQKSVLSQNGQNYIHSFLVRVTVHNNNVAAASPQPRQVAESSFERMSLSGGSVGSWTGWAWHWSRVVCGARDEEWVRRIGEQGGEEDTHAEEGDT